MAKPALTRKPQRAQGFVYKRRDPNVLKQRAEQTGGRFDSPFLQGYDVFRPKVGDNLIRILPPTWDNAQHYAYDLYMHRYVGQDQSSYLCPYKMLGKHCPICDAAKEAKDAGELDEAKALGYGKVCCTWVIDRDDDQKEHPMLYPMGWMLERDIAALCVNKRTGEALTIDHPTEGYDITIKRSGQKLMTRYLPQVDREMSNINDDEDAQERILAYTMENPIPEVLRFYEPEYLAKVISGTTTDRDSELEEDDEVEDVAPVRKPSRKLVVEDEDEPASTLRRPVRKPVVEEEVEGEEEEDAAPPPPRRRAAAAPPPEEEDEEFPFEEDEPVPAPRRRAAAPVEEEDEPAPRARPTRRVAPVQEEEEVIEEEEDAAPPPPRRRAAAAPPPEEEDERTLSRPLRRPARR